MTPADYYDWWFYSGICPGIPTRPANFAVLRERLSAPGVDLIILWGVLRDNADLAETSYIVPNGIYGSHARIANAARAVGATRLAEFLTTVPAASVVPESHRELKQLLKQFAAQHKVELAADIARHGDPRTKPGFDKRQARRKCDEQWCENNCRYQIADQIPFFIEPLNELRQLLAKGMTLPEISGQSEEVAHLILGFPYDFPRWAESPQPAEVARFLEECRRLTEQYPRQFPAWGSKRKDLFATYDRPSPLAVSVSADPGVLGQLEAIGPYKSERVGPMTILTWATIQELQNAVAPMGLRFTYQGESPAQLLEAWPEARRRFAAALPAMTQDLLALGRQQYADDELRPAAEELLSEVTDGMLDITAEENQSGLRISCSWEVEWDPEHGCLFEIDAHGGAHRAG